MSLSLKEATELAQEVYTYGYPLVSMEYTRGVMTNCVKPTEEKAPMGQLIRKRAYTSAQDNDVTTPNADTLYTQGFIDTKKEPWILSLPDMSDRYSMFPLLDGWTEVFEAPGMRTTGTKAQTYAITGPEWSSTLPEGVTEYKSPTALVWILGRIYSSGTQEDFQQVHDIQDKISLTPLSAYDSTYTHPEGKVDPTVDMSTPTRDQVEALDIQDFFSLLAELLFDNPPAPEDKPIVEKMTKLGIVAGQKFDLNASDSEIVQGLKAVPKQAQKTFIEATPSYCSIVNGWLLTDKTASYGTDYLNRAIVAAIGLGANLPQDSVYPLSVEDCDKQPYTGENEYILHFDAGELPPVHSFWSLTMYDSEMFFVENPLNRYTISQRDKLVTNDDGSIDVYLQHAHPGSEKEANWLPAPQGKFNLMLRMYWPTESKPSILDGSWQPPAVVKTN